MNVYDFDGTIYRGDSSVDFYRFMLRRHPAAVLRALPRFLLTALLHVPGTRSLKEVKEQYFAFLQHIDNVQADVVDFWEQGGLERIMPWYQAQKAADDLIISASPVFLLRYPCQQLNVALIATGVDPKSGRFLTENCKGEEKVRRFRAVFPEAAVGGFYSDSLSDSPMAELAEHAFLIKNGTPQPWHKE